MSQELIRRLIAAERRLEALATVEQAATMRSGFLVTYDGTRWVTSEMQQTLIPYQLVTLPYTGASPNTLLINRYRNDYGMYMTRCAVYLFVSTTNNGSNYWTVRLTHNGTQTVAFDTSADSANTNLYKNADINTAYAASNSFDALEVSGKTGTPGSLTVAAAYWYQLVIP